MDDYVELFAGAGGWSLAAESLGLTGIGIELDEAACITREKAGFDTIRADVREQLAQNCLGPAGLIASPPCQTFSAAGNGSGRADMALVLEALRVWSWEGEFADPRTRLILEPLRWILFRLRSGKPFEWIAMEQVPACLPIFQGYAAILEETGYFTATGFVHAERYGVPQTRKRAVLLAHRNKPVWLPAQTHSRYYSRDPRRLDHGFPKWVSMAEALGWDPDFEVVSNYGTGGDPAARGRRSGDEPAATVTSKVDRNVVYRTSTMARATVRSLDQPAPTIAFGNDMKSAGWLRSNYSTGSSHTGTAAERGRAYRSLDEPAFTVSGRGGDTWVHDRPATTVNCDPRISKPGHHDANVPGSQQHGAIRVSVAEAGVLQSFPADFPWGGRQTDQYRQVGNAIPPLMAAALLREVASVSLDACRNEENHPPGVRWIGSARPGPG